MLGIWGSFFEKGEEGGLRGEDLEGCLAKVDLRKEEREAGPKKEGMGKDGSQHEIHHELDKMRINNRYDLFLKMNYGRGHAGKARRSPPSRLFQGQIR